MRAGGRRRAAGVLIGLPLAGRSCGASVDTSLFALQKGAHVADCELRPLP